MHARYCTVGMQQKHRLLARYRSFYAHRSRSRNKRKFHPQASNTALRRRNHSNNQTRTKKDSIHFSPREKNACSIISKSSYVSTNQVLLHIVVSFVVFLDQIVAVVAYLLHSIRLFVPNYTTNKTTPITICLQSIVESKDAVVHVVLSGSATDQLKHFAEVQGIVPTNGDASGDKNDHGAGGIYRRLHVLRLDGVLHLTHRLQLLDNGGGAGDLLAFKCHHGFVLL